MGRTEDTRVIIETVVQGFSLISELISWISVIAETDSEGKKLSVKKPLGDDSYTFDDLYDVCNSRVVTHFGQQFGYAYLGNDSLPPQQIRQDKILSSEDFFSADANSLGAIPAAVRASIKGTGAAFAERDLIGAISARIQTYTSGKPTNAWILDAFTLNYTGTNTDGDKETYQYDISWIYCTTGAPKARHPETRVNTLFLYSVGVGYITNPWLKRLTGVSPAIPIVRIAFVYTTMVIGTALAAFIYSQKDKPADLIITVDILKGHGTISLSPKTTPRLDPGTGEPSIPYAWAVDALARAGVKSSKVEMGTATVDEAQEIALLKQWDAQDLAP